MGHLTKNKPKTGVADRGTILTDTRAIPFSGIKLTNDSRSSRKFMLTIDHKLDNHYQFKDLKSSELQIFSTFLLQTVGKSLTISEVDKLFLRTKGPKSEEVVCGNKVSMVHYGKDRARFRVFGYYNDDGYFVIHRLDPKHNFHKS